MEKSHKHAEKITIQQVSARHHQQGIALAISLILLVVVTVLGIAAISGTAMQNRMAANQYDRMLAFQASSSVLQVVIDGLASGSADVMSDLRDCTEASAINCIANPFKDATMPNNFKKKVAPSEYKAGPGYAEDEPSYVLEYLGEWPDPSSITGANQLVSSQTYGQVQLVDFYRATVRSGEPRVSGDRAIVTVQAVLMKR